MSDQSGPGTASHLPAQPTPAAQMPAQAAPGQAEPAQAAPVKLNVLGAIGLVFGVLVVLMEALRGLLFLMLWEAPAIQDFYPAFSRISFWISAALVVLTLAFSVAGLLLKGQPKLMAAIGLGVGLSGIPLFGQLLPFLFRR